MPVMGTHSSYQLVVTLLEVSEKEEGIVASYLPTGPLQTHSWLEPVPRCEPSTFQPLVNDIATAPLGLVLFNVG